MDKAARGLFKDINYSAERSLEIALHSVRGVQLLHAHLMGPIAHSDTKDP